MDEQGPNKPDGEDPSAEAKAEDCEANAAECEFRAGAVIDQPHDSFFQPDDELYETFKAEPIPLRLDSEGLPVPIDSPQQFAPPFGPDTVVCIEDTRAYVELWSDELTARGWMHQGRTTWTFPSGDTAEGVLTRPRYDQNGLAQERQRYAPEQVEERFGQKLVGNKDGWIPVRPIRERCQHYRRQVLGNDDIPDPKAFGHKIVFRLCAARRSNGGALMSLRDEAIYACDLRHPVHEESVQEHLDAPDEKAIREKRHLVLVRAWGQRGEEVDLRDEPPPGGIFAER